MARTEITPDTVNHLGVSPQESSTGTPDGFKFPNDGKKFVVVKNTDASDHDVTFKTEYSEAGLLLNQNVVTIPANNEKKFWKFPTTLYTLAADPGYVHIDFESGEEEHFEVEVYDLP